MDVAEEGAKLEAQAGRLRRLVPGAEWKVDLALALAGGDVARAGDLLVSGKSDAWWAEQRSKTDKMEPEPEPDPAEPAEPRERRQPGPEEVAVDKPRTFSKKLSSLEFSVIVGSRSAPYTDGNDLTKVLAGLLEASKDPHAVEKYGAAAMPEQLQEIQEALTRGMAGIALEGEVSMQLMTNVLFAYTLETFFGGTGYSVLNTSLRNLVEYPALAPLARLFHHSVSTLAASDAHGYDGLCYRAMKLPEDVISQYKVEHVQQHGRGVLQAGRPRAGDGALPQGPRHLPERARAGAPACRRHVHEHGDRV
eukprot:COSAG04_NODE_20_length_39202_cov_9.993530_25_plen_307_part_00